MTSFVTLSCLAVNLVGLHRVLCSTLFCVGSNLPYFYQMSLKSGEYLCCNIQFRVNYWKPFFSLCGFFCIMFELRIMLFNFVLLCEYKSENIRKRRKLTHELLEEVLSFPIPQSLLFFCTNNACWFNLLTARSVFSLVLFFWIPPCDGK